MQVKCFGKIKIFLAVRCFSPATLLNRHERASIMVQCEGHLKHVTHVQDVLIAS